MQDTPAPVPNRSPLHEFSKPLPLGVRRLLNLDDLNDSAEAGSVMGTVLAAFGIAFAGTGIFFFDRLTSTTAYWGGPLIIGSSIGLFAIVVTLIRLRWTVVASLTVTLYLWSLPTWFIYQRGGLSKMSGAALVLPILFAAASLGGRGLAVTLVLCVFSIVALAYAESQGLILHTMDVEPPLSMHAMSAITILGLTALLVEYGVRRTSVQLYQLAQEKKALTRAEKRRERQIHLALALGRMGQLLLERDRLDVVCQLAAERLIKLVHAERIWIGQSTARSMEALASIGFHTLPNEFPLDQLPKLAQLHEHGILEFSHDNDDWRAFTSDLGNRTCLVLGLTNAKELSGLLLISCKPGATVNRDQRAFLEAVAGLLSAAIARQDARNRQMQAQKMGVVGRMAAGVAHDFNNLLAVVEATSHELDGDTYDRAAIIRDLFDVSQRGSLMTRRILAFTKPEEDDVLTLAIDSVITTLIPMMRRLMGPKIEIDTQLNAHHTRILASRGAIEQILMNLAVNAADAMTSGGSFQIQTRVDPSNRVFILVKDNGKGMDAQTLEQAFQPFFTTKKHGTGLGLATVLECVNDCKGQLIAESTPQQGTTITLQFPGLLHFEPTPTAEPRTVTTIQDGCVLLVDDDETVRRALRRLIERAGYVVVEASDGVDALQKIQEGLTPDVVLTDLQMPNMDGVTLIRRITTEHDGIPCIAITGWMEEREDSPLAAGAIKLLRKPVKIDLLLHTLANARSRGAKQQ